MTVSKLELPRIIEIGKDVFSNLDSLADRLGLKPPFIVVHDEITYKIAGKAVVERIGEKDTQTYQISGSTVAEVESLQEMIKKQKPKLLFAVGGGKVIDVCKLASFREKCLFVSIPTDHVLRLIPLF